MISIMFRHYSFYLLVMLGFKFPLCILIGFWYLLWYGLDLWDCMYRQGIVCSWSIFSQWGSQRFWSDLTVDHLWLFDQPIANEYLFCADLVAQAI